jgi:hypothetical protein
MIALNRFTLASLPMPRRAFEDRDARLPSAPSNCDFEILMGDKIPAYVRQHQPAALNLLRS